MRFWFPILGLLLTATTAVASEYVWDDIDTALSYSAFHDNLRAHLSGTLDLEQYWFDQPTPDIIYSNGNRLTVPRLTLFLDTQVGSKLYAFAQFRVDRGFDPGSGPWRGRLDEYALRYSVFDDGQLTLQVGKFGTVVGNWVRRHGSWTDPFITAPMPYSNLTGLPGAIPVQNVGWPRPAHLPWPTYYYPDGTYQLNTLPILWGPSYAQGVSVTSKLGPLSLAAEMKSASLASAPNDWSENRISTRHPTVSGEINYQPNPMWNMGVSASSGGEVTFATYTVPEGFVLRKYREDVIGQDFEFSWHHFQLWAEAYEARFKIKDVGNAAVLGYYVEAKYKFAPRFFAAIRWNQQTYNTVTSPDGYVTDSLHDTWRIDVAPTYRFTPYTQAKFQYSFQNNGTSGQRYSHLLAVQLTQRF